MNPMDPNQPRDASPPDNASLPPVSGEPSYGPPADTENPSADFNVDYLNKIASDPQKSVNKFAVLGLIGGVVIAAIVAFILMAVPKTDSADSLILPIAGRITTLEAVTSAQQKHLNEDHLNVANAALNSSFDTMSTEVQAIIKTRGLLKKQTKIQIASEKTYQTKLLKILDDAYQRGTLDRTYATQMTYELTILTSQINSLKKSAKNKDIVAFCDEAVSNIEPIFNSFSSFDSSKQ